MLEARAGCARAQGDGGYWGSRPHAKVDLWKGAPEEAARPQGAETRPWALSSQDRVKT